MYRGKSGKYLLVLVFLVLASLVSACENPGKEVQARKVKSSHSPAEGKDASPVVTINGKMITRGEYKEALYDLYAQNHLEAFIEDQLVEQRARELGIKVDDGVVQQEVVANVDVLKKTRFANNEDSMRAALLERGMSLEGWKKDLESKARRKLLLNALVKKERGAGSIALKRKFEQKYGEGGQKYKVRHILISSKIINTSFYSKDDYLHEKDVIEKELQTRGRAILAELSSGKSFEDLARVHSNDFTANRGGSLGESWKGRFGEAFDRAASSLKPGKLSGLIQGRRGYHILEVTGVNKGMEFEGSAMLISTAVSGPTDKRSAEEREEAAQKKISEIEKGLEAGTAFEEIARAKSDDVATKGRGGSLGVFNRRRLGKEVDEVLSGLKPGTVTDPIKTPRGYWIVKLDKKRLVPKKDRRVVRHIFLSSEFDAIKKARLEGKIDGMAMARAKEIMERLNKGEAFADLARTESEDAYTRKAGGEYYNYKSTSLGPEVWKAVQGMDEKAKPVLVKSDRGYHIVQVTEKSVTKFQDVKETLLAELGDDDASALEIRTFLENLKSDSTIKRAIAKDPAMRAPAPKDHLHKDNGPVSF